MKTKEQIKIDRMVYQKEWRRKNKDRINNVKRKSYQKNKEEINMKRRENRKKPEVKARLKELRNIPKAKEVRRKSRKAYNSRKDIKEKRNLDRRKRRKNDVTYAIAKRLRCRLNHSITYYTNTGKIMPSKKYGVDFEIIIEYLKPFPKDIKNYEVDHIIPVSWFDLNNPEEVEWAFAPENHQWMLIIKNRRKSNKFIEVVER